MLLEESLAQQMNKMMDNFTQILRWLPTGEASSLSDHATPFKVQVNFGIPLFEGWIDWDVVDMVESDRRVLFGPQFFQ
jgi:hypothetical protein